MEPWKNALLVLISLILGVALAYVLKPVIFLISPLIIAYVIYKFLSHEDWHETLNDLKGFFNVGTVIEEVYLIKNDGLLLRHYTRQLRPDVDQDVVAGMLNTITAAVKEGFKQPSQIDEIRFKDMEIQLARGRYVTLAVVISGIDKEGVRRQMKRCVNEIEERCESWLKNWKGDMEQINAVEYYIQKFVKGEYSTVSSFFDL